MSQQLYTNIRLANQIVFDFHKLACLEPELRPYVLILNCRTVCNFKNQSSLITLTKAIMKHCFGLSWNCPPANLCPRVPARLNYLLWANAQLGSVKINKVLDIGTGATLVYPLLGYSLFGWKFIATEIDKESFEHSQTLIRVNQLQYFIDLRLNSIFTLAQEKHDDWASESVIGDSVSAQDQIELVVCNPPFFEEQSETLTTMTEREHHTTGGEYSFFFNLYRQSFGMPNIQYFTCLIGLQSNFQDAKAMLIQQHKEYFLETIRFGEIQQGNNLRYIVMWKVQPALFQPKTA